MALLCNVYPKTPNPEDEASMLSILNSEAGILQKMAEYFCDELVSIPRDGTPPTCLGIIPQIDDIEKRIKALELILCSFSGKETAIAEIIKAVTKKNAADMGIPFPECFCDEKKKHCK